MYRKKHIFQASRASGYQVKDINAVILNWSNNVYPRTSARNHKQKYGANVKFKIENKN
jgi:hypothetical protein